MGQGDALKLGRRQLLVAGAMGLASGVAGCDAPPPVLQGGFTGAAHERGHWLRQPLPQASTVPATIRRTQVLILGGGVAGLAAARRLQQGGVEDFALLDLEDEPGGNSRAASIQGIACPLGAHYLPTPPDGNQALLGFLEQIGLCRRVAGRWVYDERHLCHSPQERLFFQGHWQEGLLPVSGVSQATLRQYRQFARQVQASRQGAGFAIPAASAAMDAAAQALDALSMQAWLDQQGLMDPHLRWYLDYCCRDDYGAGLTQVSAWAAVHYFASRHGFHGPEAELAERDEGVLTWPEGNAHLVRAMAAPLLAGGAARLQGASLVHRVQALRHDVQVDVLRAPGQSPERWIAKYCILALPMFVAMRVLEQPPEFLRQAAQRMSYSAWLVANIHIREPLNDADGAAPAWDNVLYGAATAQGGLGYVDARHQKLDPTPGPTVLTHYRALGPDASSRQSLLQKSWGDWSQQILHELAQAHPDLARKSTRIDITRYGHAMAMPGPGLQTHLRQAFAGAQALPSGIAVRASKRSALRTPVEGRLLFAHSDWSGYSIFEEAFARGDAAAALLV